MKFGEGPFKNYVTRTDRRRGVGGVTECDMLWQGGGGVAQTLCHTVEFSTHAHKRVPSVYAGTEIKPNDIGNRQAVSYSGPTYIAIRSGSTPPTSFYWHWQ